MIVNNNYFSVIDTDKKAYFLGFFIADGCVSYNVNARCYGRFSFLIQEKDGYILDILAKELGNINSTLVIHRNKHNCKRLQKRLRWTSKIMFYDVQNYNIGQQKTLSDFTFPFEKVPKKYWGALIRGFLDGDGSFEQDKGKFTPSVCGPNFKWIVQVGNLVNSVTGLTYKIYKRAGKTCNYYTLRWTANRKNKTEKITKLYNFLYENAEVWMTRKRQKIEAYLEYRANQIRVKGIWQCNA